MPFYSASFGIAGFQLSIYKILPVFLLLNFLLSKEKISPKMLLIPGYFLFVTSIFYFLAMDDNLFEFIILLGRKEFSAYVAPLVQGILFLMVIIQLWLLKKNTEIDYLKIISFYVYGCMILVLIGYLQIFCYMLNLPWFDFWFLNDAMGRSTADGLGSHAKAGGLYRMSSLGGEPRHFSALLGLSLMLQLYLKTTGKRIPFITGKRSSLTALFILSGMIFSFSSSGLLGLVIGFSTYFLLTDFKKMVVFFIICSVILIYFSENLIVFSILWKLASLDLILYAAKKDAFAIQAITHNWIHFIFGYGTNLAELFVPDYYLIQETPFGLDNRYLTDNPMESTVAPTSVILQILVNGGVSGLFLILFLIYSEIRGCNKKTKCLFIAILGMVCVTSSLIFSMAIFFFAIIIAFERTPSRAVYK